MQRSVYSMKGDSSWFIHDRFGMFIHWGLYSLGARHEWLKNIEAKTDKDYQKYFDHFEPDLYDPGAWADAAAKAGMKYFVITTKHHEGFCLWDTKYTDYKASKTPLCGKDLLTPMVNSFRNRGIKVGFYHSLLDWHHPDYTVDRSHALRNNKEYLKNEAKKDLAKYRKYLYGQVEELMTRFGKIDVIWFDFSIKNIKGEKWKGKGKNEWGAESLIKMIRGYQPDILINDRLQIPQDIFTPEQDQPVKWPTINGKKAMWESCHTFSGSWGYHRDEQSWKSTEDCIKLLVDTVSKGGNLLLNVGPTSRGEFDFRAMDRLNGIGEWMKRHSRSIYGCTEAPKEFSCPPDSRYTYNAETKRLYLHLFSWPAKYVYLYFADKIEYAQLLNDGSEIKFWINSRTPIYDNALCATGHKTNEAKLALPDLKPNVEVPVVEIFLK